MSWQDDVMIEQERSDALWNMGEAEWKDLDEKAKTEKRKVGRPRKPEEEKKQRVKEYNAKYWAEHRIEISTKRKKQYQEDKEKILARNRQWFKENKDKWNEYQREYRKRKRESIDKPKKA